MCTVAGWIGFISVTVRFEFITDPYLLVCVLGSHNTDSLRHLGVLFRMVLHVGAARGGLVLDVRCLIDASDNGVTRGHLSGLGVPSAIDVLAAHTRDVTHVA